MDDANGYRPTTLATGILLDLTIKVDLSATFAQRIFVERILAADIDRDFRGFLHRAVRAGLMQEPILPEPWCDS